MMLRQIFSAILVVVVMQLFACGQPPAKNLLTKYSDLALSASENQTIERTVDQLVFTDGDASNEPVFSPGVKDKSPEYAERFKKVQEAFDALTKLKVNAFPVLLKHLDDKRQSINFRNHYLANSVGDACMWIIFFQLQDRPKGYSSYGYQRKGKDNKDHLKPYWEGTPFDDAGGVKKWIAKNEHLSYIEMQVKCLQWLLEGEKKIGACDPASYFENILPLEVQILRRQLETGADVKKELAEKDKALRNQDARIISADLLPSK